MENTSASCNEETMESRPTKNVKRLFQDDVTTNRRHSAQSIQKLTGDLESSNDAVLGELQLILRDIQARCTVKEEVLRKLEMVKTYRTKNNLSQLEALINKWRQACQEAVVELAQSSCENEQKPTTCKPVLDQLQIDYSLIRYNPEEDCFY